MFAVDVAYIDDGGLSRVPVAIVGTEEVGSGLPVNKLESILSTSLSRCWSAMINLTISVGRSERPFWISWISDITASPSVTAGGFSEVVEGCAVVGSAEAAIGRTWCLCLCIAWPWMCLDNTVLQRRESGMIHKSDRGDSEGIFLCGLPSRNSTAMNRKLYLP